MEEIQGQNETRKFSETTKELLWVGLVVAFILLYTIPVQLFDLGSPWKFYGLTQLRAFVPAFVLFLVAADTLRCILKGGRLSLKEPVEEEDALPTAVEGVARPSPRLPADGPAVVRTADEPKTEAPPQAETFPPAGTHTFGLPENPFHQATTVSARMDGKTLYKLARALPHRAIPDFDHDREYLELLGESAVARHPPALFKLGEYAMRRGAWVEAYYWMTLARRNGMRGLSATLREIRMNWALSGFPVQTSNTNSIFTAKAGSIGRALLRLDSGHESAKAKTFLKMNYPEFLR